MAKGLKIRQLIFGEQGLTFIVQRMEDEEYFHCAVMDLFSNDQLLAEFNLSDIRLISYFAAATEFELDQNFLKKLKADRSE
jgi:hypothetical protein